MCKSLDEKPKLFLIGACRGISTVGTRTKNNFMSFIHQAEDLFYGYASSKNCLSFAGRGGDLFIVKL